MHIIKVVNLASVVLAACALALPGSGSPADQKVVWQIGDFDHSSAEFHGQEGTDAAIVDVSAPEAAAHWPASQAGSRNVKAGARPHPRLVRFRLNSAPAGMYALELSVLTGNPRVPRLELDLNGSLGGVYLNRRLTYFAEGRMDSPINGEAHELIPIEASLLREGGNELRITAVDDTADETGDSSVEWDALRLLRYDEPADSSAQTTIDPTWFYVRDNGASKEIVDVTVTLHRPVAEGSLLVRLNGAEFPAKLASGRFGEQRFEFAVPEFANGAEARVSVTLDGKTAVTEKALTPRRKFTVMMVPHNHLDIGFTDYQPKIEELQNRNFDRLLEEMRTEGNLRFSVDGAWPVEQYLRTRGEAAQRQFLEQVREGRISIPAQYANLMAGGASLETLVRSLYAGHALNRNAGQNAEYANITDVPAVPWAYSSVLHAAGIRYFAQGANDDRGPQPLYGRWQTRSPFWWEGPDGSKVLMAYTRQYSQVWFVCGLPPQEAGCREGLPAFFQTYESPGYAPDVLLMYGSQLENTDLIPGEGAFVRRWNEKYAWPRLEIATFPDYFRRIERDFGDKLETVRGDFGPYWEDGIGTDAQFASLYRQTESRAAAVETLASMAAVLRPQFAPPLDRLRRLWSDLILYAEHTYTSWGGYSRPDSEESRGQIETKHFHVTDACEQAHWIANESMSRLLDGIGVEPPALVVFNSLPHERDGLVELDLDSGMELAEAGDGAPVAVETLSEGNEYRHVRFLAERMPALGYRVYVLKAARNPAPAATSAVSGNSVENAFYRVTVDPARAAVTSLFDKQLGRELVDAKSPYLLNQYLYVSGGDGTRLIYMRDHMPAASLRITAAMGPASVQVRQTPWGKVMTITYSGPHAHSIVTEIRLFRSARQIEFVNRVSKDACNDKEAIYFAFPFAAPAPRFEYEGQTGTVDPARDTLAGGNREWFTVGHWARVSGGGVSAAILPLDGPLATFGDINRGRWPEKFSPISGTIFAYALNNYWHTNFPRVQSGEFTFRYLLTSGTELSSAALSRLGREALMPLEIGQLTPSDKVGMRGSLPARDGSFLAIDGEGVELETIKPAEDGRGNILRLLETSGRTHVVRLRGGLYQIDQLWETDALETDHREIAISGEGYDVELPAYAVVTVRAMLRPNAR